MTHDQIKEVVDRWLLEYDPHFHARDAERREKLVEWIVALSPAHSAADSKLVPDYAKAIKLLQRWREIADPEEIKQQKESWAQLEAALNAKPPSEPATQEIRPTPSDEVNRRARVAGADLARQIGRQDYAAAFAEIIERHFTTDVEQGKDQESGR